MSNEQEVDESDNCVFIGKKPTMAYVFAVQTQAQTHSIIKILARGRSISQAADVSQIALNRFLQGWILETINLTTEEKQTTPEAKHVDRVSVIEIILKKQ